jgi:acyl dehydratase
MAELKWYFEDFEPGRVILAGSRTLCEDEIVAFAMHFDPQPFHVNRAAAAESHFGGIIASGWHTCSIMMRLVVDGFLSEAASMGSPGVDEIRWLAPVRPGDTLTVTTTVLDARPSSSKPDRGVVHTMWEAKNQHGETVATVKGMGMFMRRPVQHQAMH